MSTSLEYEAAALARRIMHASKFSSHDVLLAIQWMALKKNCPRCPAAMRQACRHLTDIRLTGWGTARVVKHPHGGRVDWVQLANELRRKGYNLRGTKKIR